MSDLSAASWSVICSDPKMPIRSQSTTYDEAARRMKVLQSMGVSGLTIVTDAAASRIKEDARNAETV